MTFLRHFTCGFAGGLLLLGGLLTCLAHPVGTDLLRSGFGVGELILGAWLCSGVASKYSRLAGLFAFGSFVAYLVVTLWQGASPAASCGCFGSHVHVARWETLATDIAIFVGLASPQRGSALSCHSFRSNVAMVAGLSLVPVVVFGLNQGAITNQGVAQGVAVGSELKMLNPQDWVGKNLPIAEEIKDVSPDVLNHGNVLLVLYDPQCDACQTALKTCRAFISLKPSVVLVEVSVVPAQDHLRPSSSKVYFGNLGNLANAFITTPTIICLHNGRVTGTAEEFVSLDLLQKWAGNS